MAALEKWATWALVCEVKKLVYVGDQIDLLLASSDMDVTSYVNVPDGH